VKMAIQWLCDNGHISIEKGCTKWNPKLSPNRNTYLLSIGHVVHGNDMHIVHDVPLHGERGAPDIGHDVPLHGEHGAPPYIVEPTNDPTNRTTNEPIPCQQQAADVSKKPGSDAPKSKPKPEYETDPLGKLNPGFCEFYAIWPRRVKRKDAFRAYLKMVKSDSDHELLVTKTRQAVAGIFASRQLDKVPHPSTWINSLDWKDDT